ncbi:hypothetical protein MKX03_032343 [Papaver bracteatum]|nr:hypothetical protein MKX03_032343 [Papaver bracteatum]
MGRKRSRSGNEIPKTEDENSSDSERMKNALENWTNYEELEKIVAPWVKNVDFKMTFHGYQTQRQVYDDFCICKALRAKLEAEDRECTLTIRIYAAELWHSYAKNKQHKMLASFERMLADNAVSPRYKEWIREKLEEVNNKRVSIKKLLKKFKGDIESTWSFLLKEWGEKVKNAIEEKTKEHRRRLKSYSHNAKGFHAANFDNKQKQFKCIEKEILDGSAAIDAVIESCYTFGVTLHRLKHATGGILRRVFFYLPADNDQKYLLKKLIEEERKKMY